MRMRMTCNFSCSTVNLKKVASYVFRLKSTSSCLKNEARKEVEDSVFAELLKRQKEEKGPYGFLVPSLEDDEICCSAVPGDH